MYIIRLFNYRHIIIQHVFTHVARVFKAPENLNPWKIEIKPELCIFCIGECILKKVGLLNNKHGNLLSTEGCISHKCIFSVSM